jgi:hypothetical protein
MKPPEEVKLSREDGEALIERVKASNLASDERAGGEAHPGIFLADAGVTGNQDQSEAAEGSVVWRGE